MQIMPEDEKKKLIKLFKNIELKNNLIPDLIIMNKTDEFYNFIIYNEKYSKVYSNKVYDLYQLD